VLDANGEVAWVLHRVTEVTEWMQVRSQRQLEVDPTLDDADSDLYARAQELHAAWMQASSDVDNFRAAMRSQRLIGQAVGMLMANLNIDGERAFQLLAKESQHQNIKLREIAREHIARHGG
jgi:AmiR/NasT family two-component response regulator